ncbi:MAG: 5'-methylthioadenosine/adenosylhomocysteine nucleosidase [bacterium]
MRQPIAIIAAMPEERDALLALFPEHAARRHFHTVLHECRHGSQELVIALSGVGKVNAACTLALVLSDFDIGCVINIGTAGGLQPDQRVLDLVVPREVVYTDVDLTGFGLEPGQMHGEPARFYPDPRLLSIFDELVASGAVPHTCHRGLLGSADSHIARPEQVAQIRDRFHSEVLCVEMEGGAIAHVCTRFGVPFLILRALSDVPARDGDSVLDFQTFLPRAAAVAARLCLELVKRLERIA